MLGMTTTEGPGPIIRGESERVFDYGVPRSARCSTCLHPRSQHRRAWWALLIRRPVCKGMHAIEFHRKPPPLASTPVTMPVLSCTCHEWRANP